MESLPKKTGKNFTVSVVFKNRSSLEAEIILGRYSYGWIGVLYTRTCVADTMEPEEEENLILKLFYLSFSSLGKFMYMD